MDQKAFYKATYGLYVVSAKAQGKENGCVVNTLVQVTSEPPQLAVTVNKDNFTCELMEQAGRFTAAALDQRADLLSIGRFGFRSGRDMEKFEGIPCARDAAGVPYLLDAVCARYSCKIVQSVDLGTHKMFIGEVEEAEIMSEEEPLTYAYYRNVIKGNTPKNAPSYQGK